jgi:hypothetical protein
MPRRRVIAGTALLLVVAAPLAAQQWNDPRATDLIARAVARRSGQIAESALAGYTATARGFLTFLAQVGDTALVPPVVVKADQLAVEVSWRAPDQSRQVVVGRRDTLLVPGDIGYYRDRYGIVQQNFPSTIRLGEGRDVRDVTHPLSRAGPPAYDYRLSDSLFLDLPQQRLAVYRVDFRPKDDRAPLAVGAAYLDRATADIVRLELTFTEAAILDKRIEKLSVVLENQLVDGRFWLPRRQELEVQRAATWLDLDVRGIIRGRWQVGDYDVTRAPERTTFTGPPIQFAPLAQQRAYPFEGPLLDVLRPEDPVVRSEDIVKVQAQAAMLLERRLRERDPGVALGVPAISDVVRVTRAEGPAVGAAMTVRLPADARLRLRARYGTGDARAKGEATASVPLPAGRRLTLSARRDYADAGAVREVSGVRNSLATQEFGSDYTQPFEERAFAVDLTLGRAAGVRWRVGGAQVRHAPVRVAWTPARGAFDPVLPVAPSRGWSAALSGDGVARRVGDAMLTGDIAITYARLTRDDGTGDAAVARAVLRGEAAAERWLVRGAAIATDAREASPVELRAYLGGPVSGPGYRYHEFVGRSAGYLHAEWRTPVPFVAVPLARYGRLPSRATLAPFAHVVCVDALAGAARGSGCHPALGVGFEPFLGQVRVDVARGLRDGRWTLGVDVARAWWPVL